jgi:hypothetical protein
VPVEKYLNEYKLNFAKHVSEAAEPARLRRYESLLKLLDIDKESFLESGQPMEKFGKSLGKWLKKERSSVHPFDPLEDDPSSLIAEALDWGSLIEDVVMEEGEVERYNKAWGAWNFSQKDSVWTFPALIRDGLLLRSSSSSLTSLKPKSPRLWNYITKQ